MIAKSYSILLSLLYILQTAHGLVLLILSSKLYSSKTPISNFHCPHLSSMCLESKQMLKFCFIALLSWLPAWSYFFQFSLLYKLRRGGVVEVFPIR